MKLPSTANTDSTTLPLEWMTARPHTDRKPQIAIEEEERLRRLPCRGYTIKAVQFDQYRNPDYVGIEPDELTDD
jgi:hypothetical protein